MAGTVTFGERIAPTRRAVVATLGRWAPVMTLAAVCGYALFVMAMRVAFISVGNDDGYYAYVSRNVAEGHGYVTSYGETAYTFNPGVSLGPAIILPGALLQAVFGSQYWVPNLVVPLIVLPVVVTIGWLLNRRFGVPVLGLAVLAAVSLAFTDERNYDGEIVRQLALWTHQMGDIPAVAFILLVYVEFAGEIVAAVVASAPRAAAFVRNRSESSGTNSADRRLARSMTSVMPRDRSGVCWWVV